jgi:hypothetical protein
VIRDDLLEGEGLLNRDAARFWKFRPLRAAAVDSSVLAAGRWYRLTVAEDGIYRLDAASLGSAGINISTVNPQRVKIYGNGGRELPENILLPRPIDLIENAIYVEGEADGQFDSGDYILFYGKSTRGWSYNPGTRTFRHYIHHYTEVNYYWLSLDGAPGRRMVEQPSLTTGPAFVPDRFTDLVVVENERVNLVNSGKDWYDVPMNPGTGSTYTASLPGLAGGEPALFRHSLVSRSNPGGWFIVREGNTVIDSVGINFIDYGSDYGFANARESQVLAVPSSNPSQLSFTYVSTSASAMFST